MKSKSTRDALVEEDKTNVMKWHGRAEKNPRNFLSWLEILAHPVQVYNDDQHQCPEKLVYNTVRLHGSHWQKGTSLFTYGYSEKTEIPSYSQRSEEIEESDEQESAFSFRIIQPDLACENGLAFHTENSAPPTVCIFDLGCTRAMGLRRAVEAFCSYVDSHPNSGPWYEIQPTSSRFFFAISQQPKCTEKLVIFMYDNGWNAQFTEFDIVEEGDVPWLT